MLSVKLAVSIELALFGNCVFMNLVAANMLVPPPAETGPNTYSESGMITTDAVARQSVMLLLDAMTRVDITLSDPTTHS